MVSRYSEYPAAPSFSGTSTPWVRHTQCSTRVATRRVLAVTSPWLPGREADEALKPADLRFYRARALCRSGAGRDAERSPEVLHRSCAHGTRPEHLRRPRGDDLSGRQSPVRRNHGRVHGPPRV